MTQLSHQITHKEKVIISTFSVIYLIASIAMASLIANLLVERQVRTEQEALMNKLSMIRSNIESKVYIDTYLTDSLAMMVTIDPSFSLKHWDTIARQLLKKATYVRNIAIAPNDVITRVYPLKGNEKALGINFRNIPAQYESVKQARKQASVYITHPLKLVQGGRAIIARYPIFTDFPNNKAYWGTVSVVIDYQRLIADAGIATLPNTLIALTAQKGFFYGDDKVLNNFDTKLSVNLPSGGWELYANFSSIATPEVMKFRWAVQGCVIVICLLIYFVFTLLYRHYMFTHRDAMHDELTRLPNRRFALNHIGQLIERRAANESFVLLNIDLNNFKTINDTYGHNVGDEYLKYIADMLTRCVRKTDVVARMGGDEFIVVMRGIVTCSQVDLINYKIRRYFERHPFLWKTLRLHGSFAVGHVLFKGQDITLDALLALADQNMYREKANFKRKLGASKES
ncbi:diguanylate cyclase domain-containing protein [Vibrio tritonius]|uniref:diguanylate cyclase domain-containing protein n=1 Tax=Vibrio tritonius TaxID=1435069 RepID=UPI00315DEF80